MDIRSFHTSDRVIRLILFLAFTVILTTTGNIAIRGQGTCASVAAERPVVEQTADLQHLWSTCAGLETGAKGMIAYDHRLFVADFYSGELISFDLLSGQKHWDTPVQGAFDLLLDIPRKRIYTNVIYGALRDIYAWDIDTGRVVWVNNVNDNTRTNYDPFLLADGQIIAHGDSPSDVYQVDVNTGKYGPKLTTTSEYVFPDGYGWQVTQGRLRASDALTGQTVWQSSDPILNSYCSCIHDIQVNAKTILVDFGSTLMAFDKMTTTHLWATRIEDRVGLAALTENYVYILDLKAKLHILSVQDGSEVAAVTFKPADPGHDDYLLDSESISSSQLVTNDDLVAIHWGDTHILDVYRIAPRNHQ